MPRYFFEIHDGGPRRDDIGLECGTLGEVRAQVIQILPDIAREDIPKDGDLGDDSGRAVYAATLTDAGLRLTR